MEIGTANYDRKGKTNIFKIKDGDNIFRILPPLGSMAKSGKWFVYKKVEWGYKNSKGKNRPFQDPSDQDFKTKMWKVDTEARRKREDIAAKLEIAKDMHKKGQLSKEELAKVVELKKQFNLEKKYYVNAINQKGEIGLQKIGYKAFKALEVEIKKLREQGIDPLGVDTGRFFNIHRSGDGFDTAFAVSVVAENIKVDGIGVVQKAVEHKLDESILARLANEAKDLSELDKMYPIISAEQVDRIVKEGPTAVDEILGAGDDQSSDDGDDDENTASVNTSGSSTASSNTTTGGDAGKLNTTSQTTNTSQQTTSLSETTDTKVEEKKEQAPPPTAAAAQDKNAFLASLGISNQ